MNLREETLERIGTTKDHLELLGHYARMDVVAVITPSDEGMFIVVGEVTSPEWQNTEAMDVSFRVGDLRSELIGIPVGPDGYGERVAPLHDLDPEVLDHLLSIIDDFDAVDLPSQPCGPEVVAQVEIEIERLREVGAYV